MAIAFGTVQSRLRHRAGTRPPMNPYWLRDALAKARDNGLSLFIDPDGITVYGAHGARTRPWSELEAAKTDCLTPMVEAFARVSRK